ncbi:MAG: GNAT family N-acetyltransferase [Planctomycetes bacterium]|nr:GNAT family N-acetyltransferase [Planctomycetota bacterium]
MTLSIRALDAAGARDFRSVMRRANAEAGSCLCTAAYVETWKDRTLAAPCRERMFREGVSDGFLLYDGGRAVGWCQAAPRDALVNLVRGRGFPRDAAIWGISCIVLVPEARRRGNSHEFLRLVLQELARRGVARVQVFACRYGPDEDTSAFLELPESLCARAGMTLEQDHPMRPVYGMALAAPP